MIVNGISILHFYIKETYCKKSLVYLASREVLFHCYRIIQNFNECAHLYFLCDGYQDCLQNLSARRDYCCICRFRKEYRLKNLQNIKSNSFELEKYCLNILKDLVEILSVNPTVCFSKYECNCQFRSCYGFSVGFLSMM